MKLSENVSKEIYNKYQDRQELPACFYEQWMFREAWHPSLVQKNIFLIYTKIEFYKK